MSTRALPSLPDVLERPYIYLSVAQRGICEQKTHLRPYASSLPGFVPLEDFSLAFFGQQGASRVQKVAQHYGNFVWAGEFANVHHTLSYNEDPLQINGETYNGPEQYFQLMKSHGMKDHDKAAKVQAC